MRSPWMTAVACAFLYVLILSSGYLWSRVQGLDSPAYLRIERGSPDQAHYMAYVRSVSQGHWLMGNSALREHRDDQGNVVYGPMLQGFFKRVTGFRLETVVLMGNFLFPFFAFLVLFAILRGFLDPLVSILTTVIAMNVIGVSWLRIVSPQITFLTFVLYLLVFLRGDPRSAKTRTARGLFIGLLLFIQAQYALLALIIEGTDFLWQLFVQKRRLREVVTEILPTALPFLLLAALRAYLSLSGDPAIIADTVQRFGLIPSHLPTSPVLQLKVLGSLLFFLLVRFRKKNMSPESDRFLVLLLATLLALNQSIVHGFDAIFLVYYPFPVTIILWFSFVVTLSQLLAGWRTSLLVGFLSALSAASFVVHVYQNNLSMAAEAAAYEAIAAPDILALLKEQPASQVIAAPFLLADLIPALTDHTVLFNHYARFGLASDRELAERFLLYRRLFSEKHPTVDDPTYGVVFGNYAGNLSARKRTLCRMLSWRKSSDCNISIESQIYHQDVLQAIEEDHIDEASSMQAFGVSILIRSSEEQRSIPPACLPLKTIGPWSVYSCRSR